MLVMVLIHDKTCWKRYELQPREEWSLLTALSVYMAMLLMIMQQEGYDSLNLHFPVVNCFVLFVFHQPFRIQLPSLNVIVIF